jgi:hypothetical protein
LLLGYALNIPIISMDRLAGSGARLRKGAEWRGGDGEGHGHGLVGQFREGRGLGAYGDLLGRDLSRDWVSFCADFRVKKGGLEGATRQCKLSAIVVLGVRKAWFGV